MTDDATATRSEGHEATAPPRPHRYARPLRNAVILLASAFHVAAVLTWVGPSGYVRDHLLRYTLHYTLYTRTDQGWGMFAPEPLSVNRRLVVTADLGKGDSREVDLTLPLNQAIRSWSLTRVGKGIKAHDRLMGGDEPQYISGFAAHVCRELSERFHAPVQSVNLRRYFQTVSVDPGTFRTNRTPWAWGEIGIYACP